jgi:hypothetical protein
MPGAAANTFHRAAMTRDDRLVVALKETGRVGLGGKPSAASLGHEIASQIRAQSR